MKWRVRQGDSASSTAAWRRSTFSRQCRRRWLCFGGRELLPKVHPKLRVFDFNKETGGFTFQLTV
jgi:hypothetical protein